MADPLLTTPWLFLCFEALDGEDMVRRRYFVRFDPRTTPHAARLIAAVDEADDPVAVIDYIADCVCDPENVPHFHEGSTAVPAWVRALPYAELGAWESNGQWRARPSEPVIFRDYVGQSGPVIRFAGPEGTTFTAQETSSIPAAYL